MRPPANEERIDSRGPLPDPLAAYELRHQRLEGDARLEARERRAQTEVRAEAEREVPAGVALDVEAVGLGERALVAVGGAEERRHDGAARPVTSLRARDRMYSILPRSSVYSLWVIGSFLRSFTFR